MLPTLAIALSLAAPVPKAPPFPLRTDPLPKEFKLADLEDATLPQAVKGTVSLLAWETIEDDTPRSVTKVLVLKKFDKVDEKRNKYSLCFLWWNEKTEEWGHRLIRKPYGLPGDVDDGPDDYWHGCQSFSSPPTEREFASFLKHVRWTPKLGAEKWTSLGGTGVITTTLTGGGFDRDAWKAHFDRDPPVDLFPELKEEKK